MCGGLTMKIVDKREEHWQVEHLQTKLRSTIAQCAGGDYEN